MSVKMTTPREVARPQTRPITSTILDHATVKVVDHFGLSNNNGLWPSYNCIDTLTPTVMCPDPLIESGDGSPKVFNGHEWVTAYEFAVYAGQQCSLVGLDKADMESELKRVFEANQHKGVEQSLAAVRFVATDSDAPVAWGAPVDLGTYVGGVYSATIALAVLEGYAAGIYAGLPTIHMSRAVATLLEAQGLIMWEGNLAYTKNGSKVAMGGGYDIGVDQGDGIWTIYATGEVYVEMAEQVDIATQVVPGDGNGVGSDESGLSDNTAIALAERMYRVAVDCFVAQATVNVNAAP